MSTTRATDTMALSIADDAHLQNNLDAALRAARTREYSVATELLQQILTENTKNYAACKLLAWIKQRCGNYAEALEQVNYVINHVPNDIGAHYLRLSIKLSRREYVGVVTDVTNILKFTSDDAHFYYLRASAYSRMGEFSAVINDASQAIRLNKKLHCHLPAYIIRANAKLKNSKHVDYVGSMADIRTAIDNIKIRLLSQNAHLSDLLYQRQVSTFDELWEVEEEAAECAKLEYTLIDAYQVKTIIEFRSGDFHAALSSINSAIEAADGIRRRILARYNYLRINNPNENNEEIKLLKNDIATISNINSYSNYLLADVLLELGNSRESMNAIAFAIQYDPKNSLSYTANLYLVVAKLQFEDQNYDGAVIAATTAITLNKNNRVAYEFRAKTYRTQGKKEAAILDERQAIIIEKRTNPMSLKALCTFYIKENNILVSQQLPCFFKKSTNTKTSTNAKERFIAALNTLSDSGIDPYTLSTVNKAKGCVATKFNLFQALGRELNNQEQEARNAKKIKLRIKKKS